MIENECTVISLVVIRIGGAMVRVLVSYAVDGGCKARSDQTRL
jgi:hypothetical protein